MKLYIKQKVFSLTPNFTVKDADGNDVYQVKGKFFSLHSKLSIYDMENQLLAEVTKKIMSFLPTFDIVILGGDHVVLKKQFTFLRPSYILVGVPWKLQGNFLAHEYEVVDGTQPIMQLSKHWFTWGDSYELTIQNPKDALLSTCIALSIDIQMGDESNSTAMNAN